MPLYDTIGCEYAKSRPADERIVAALNEALALHAGATVLDVGAGTGKYARAMADRGFNVLAIEPSEVMRGQSMPHPRVHTISAAAEEIPLASGVADGAFIILALHHFTNRKEAFKEILRIIGRGPCVIFSFEPSVLSQFWLADYFPRLGREIESSFSKLEDVAVEVAALTHRAVRTISFPLPPNLNDRFAAAGWAKPECYLDAQVRNGISSFSLMRPEEVTAGLARLSADLTSGLWDSRYNSLRHLSYYDAGYRFIIAEEEANEASQPSPMRVG